VANEFTRNELVQALRTLGPRLLRDYFKPDPDLEKLIWESVTGNTFRSFQKLSKPPSDLFRTWAKSRLSFGVMEQFGLLKDQVTYDAFVDFHEAHLASYWHAEGRKPL
jgi:hypothetical protein